MEGIQKQEFRVRDLPTRSITLFPTRAQIVRNIKNVNLEPGINEISILGFTPTVDPHSIKVEGAGSAVISDISVELRENRDFFKEIYPDSDDENSESSDDEEEPGHTSPEDSDDENASRAHQDRKKVGEAIQTLNDDIKREAEVVSSAESRLKMLNEFGKKVEIKSGGDLSDIMQAYQLQRNKTFEDHMKGTIRQRDLKSQIDGLRKTERKLIAQIGKEKKMASKVLRKEKQAKLKRLDLKNNRESRKIAEKARVRQERCRFWARYCYVVRITLDATQYTPISRRSSISSVTDLVKPAIEDQKATLTDPDAAILSCDLSITYVTSDAYWSASYDLQLSTTSNTGTLFFDAQLVNHTSESWKDCSIILSTSQAIFSGLQDTIPKLHPWHIKLAGKSSASSDDITSSPQEAYEQRMWKVATSAASRMNSGTALIGISSAANIDRHHGQKNAGPVGSLFGVPQKNQDLFGSAANNAPQPPPVQSSGNLFGSLANNAPQPPPAQSSGGLFGAVKATSSGFGQQLSQQSIHSAGQPGSSRGAQNTSSGARFDDRPRGGTNPFASLEETVTLLESEPEPALSFQDSAMEETGLTTTYDLPGTKSLVPSSTASKQRVAHIAFTNIAFSHTIVAKYRPGAFLKAKLLNASKISLLKGPVGLTLDGAFMGRSTLPRCSSGEKFTMSLGIDPTIKVIYPKPEVKRTTGGLFSKENSTAYTRSITITNTRGSSSAGGRAVRLLVLDQVPVSEDEKLRVEVVQPRGLVEDGAGVSTGVQDENAKTGKDWGRAVASLQKGGEVNWDVELNAGKSVKLGLEYDVSLPVGDLRACASLTIS